MYRNIRQKKTKLNLPCEILLKKQKITAAILQYRMKIMQTAEKQIFKSRYDCHSGIICKKKQLQFTRKNFGTSTGFEPYDRLCVSAAVLY